MADEARLSQQVVEVLYTISTEPTARVTAEYVEVIYAEAPPLTVGLSAHIISSSAMTAALRGVTLNLAASVTASGTMTARLVGPRLAGSLLQLTQSVTTQNIINLSPSNTLTLTQSAVNGRIQTLSASNTLNLIQSVSGGKRKNAVASSSLVLTQSVSVTRPATSVLNLTHSVIVAYGGITESPSNTLNLTQTVTPLLVTNLSVTSTLFLTQSATFNMVGDQIASSQLNLKQLVVGTLVGEYVTLQSPYEGPEHIIELPKPLVGDTQNLVSDLLLKKSMNNISRTYIKRNDNQRLTYTFSMTRDKGLELESFFIYHNSDTIKLTNWKGEIWRVYLITNPIDFNQPRRGANCGPTVEVDLEFEGLKLSG